MLPFLANGSKVAARAATRSVRPSPPPNLRPGPVEQPYQGPEVPGINGEPPPNASKWVRIVNALSAVADDLQSILGDIAVCFTCNMDPNIKRYSSDNPMI